MLAPVTMNKAEKYAVSPDCAGDTGLRSFFMQNMGCSRKVYNLYVDFLYDTLEKASYKAGSLLPDVRLPEVTSFKKDYPFLKEADSLGLSNAKIDFQNAVDRFNEQKDHSSYTKRAKRRAESGTEPLTFRGLCGMPKFHSKARGYFSYTTNCQYPGEGKQLKQPTIRLSGNRLHLPKWEKDIILTVHRPLPQNAVIRNVTVSMDTDGRFYVSICYSYTLMMEMSVREAVPLQRRIHHRPPQVHRPRLFESQFLCRQRRQDSQLPEGLPESGDETGEAAAQSFPYAERFEQL